jgi:hypothetical protein
MQDQLQRQLMHHIATGMGRLDVIPDHRIDMAGAIRRLDEIVTKFGSHDHRKMLVLRDCGNLVFAQGAERNAILK